MRPQHVVMTAAAAAVTTQAGQASSEKRRATARGFYVLVWLVCGALASQQASLGVCGGARRGLRVGDHFTPTTPTTQKITPP